MLFSRFLPSALAFLYVDVAHASVCRPQSRSSASSAIESSSTADESVSSTSTVGSSTTETSGTESISESLTTTASLATNTSTITSSFVTITTTIESSGTTSSGTTSSTFFPADLFPCKESSDCVAQIEICDFVRCGCVGGFCQVETVTSDASTTTSDSRVQTTESTTAIEATTTAETITADTTATDVTTTDTTTTGTTAESSTAETTTIDTTTSDTSTDTTTQTTTAETTTSEITTSETTTTTTTTSAETTTTTETTTAETTTTTTTTSAEAQSTAFKCDVYGYLIQKRALYRVDIASGSSTLIASNIGPGGYINGIGYNRHDNQIYGMVMTSTGSTLIKIGADGTWSLLPATVSSRNIIMGDIDSNGNYWISDTGRPWWKIDLWPTSPTFGRIVASGTATHDDYMADWAYVPGGGNYLYAIQYTQTSSILVRFSMLSYTWTTLRNYGDLTGDNVWGALYASSEGIMYGSENSSGNIYKFPISPTIGKPSFLAAGPSSGYNDGARCIDSQPVRR
ncbi:Agglutinin 2 [Fusarium albosuccineum]|uniref:Agglutinin 2 n=1 Tax=Fusarium albosuccineum TaxID=1237068 RepID=A0A8H4L761_9HYPO|nr:Agglutinin 2 [Fusarium albosuccineum]